MILTIRRLNPCHLVTFILAFHFFTPAFLSADARDCAMGSDLRSPRSADRRCIAAKASFAGSIGTLSLKWKGARRTDIVVVSFDSRKAMKSREMALEADSSSIHLSGIVLARRVGGASSAKLVYHQRDLAGYFEDDQFVITAYLVSDIDVLLITGDRSVKGGEHVSGVARITAADCRSEFQFVCSDETDDRLRAIIPHAGQLLRETPEGTRCSATLRRASIWALTRVDWQ